MYLLLAVPCDVSFLGLHYFEPGVVAAPLLEHEAGPRIVLAVGGVAVEPCFESVASEGFHCVVAGVPDAGAGLYPVVAGDLGDVA